MDVPLLYEIVIIFLLSIGVTVACNKLKLPATVGFLLTGVLCGPSLLGIVDDQEAINHIAEVGVAMLLFTIGMELSGEALNRLKRPVFMGGSLQLGLIMLVGICVDIWDDDNTYQGLFWSFLIALSSSAVVLRLMQERGTVNTPAGRLSLAILVFQDIMVAPMLLSVPLLAGTLTMSPQNVLLSFLRMVLILGGVLLFARFGLNRLMEAVMRTRTREILLLTTLGLCLGTALLTAWLGLSLSLGAFLAGLLLARSQYSMSVISGILPYRDVFMSLFFISVGMLLNMNFVFTHLPYILGGVLLYTLLKTLLTLPAVLVQGYPLRTAIITSLSLAQVGEFSFVLAAAGLAAGLLSMDSYQSFLAVSVLTMMFTPGLISIAPRLADFVARFYNGKGTAESAQEEDEEKACALHDHLIIVGFGISGKHLAHVARESGIAYTVLEMNPETVNRYKATEPISHGDASQPVVLEHLCVQGARVMAIIISDPAAVRAITLEAHRLNPDLYIVARTRFLSEVQPLRDMGANAVIAEEFETSIEVFSRVLTQYLVPQQDIDTFSAHLRQENYRMVRSRENTLDSLDTVANRLPEMGVQALRLGADSRFCKLSLSGSRLREEYGVTVVAIIRGNEAPLSPDPDLILQCNDVVYLFGKSEALFAVKPLFAGTSARNNG